MTAASRPWSVGKRYGNLLTEVVDATGQVVCLVPTHERVKREDHAVEYWPTPEGQARLQAVLKRVEAAGRRSVKPKTTSTSVERVGVSVPDPGEADRPVRRCQTEREKIDAVKGLLEQWDIERCNDWLVSCVMPPGEQEDLAAWLVSRLPAVLKAGR